MDAPADPTTEVDNTIDLDRSYDILPRRARRFWYECRHVAEPCAHKLARSRRAHWPRPSWARSTPEALPQSLLPTSSSTPARGPVKHADRYFRSEYEWPGACRYTC
jgi:hypothetical protein